MTEVEIPIRIYSSVGIQREHGSGFVTQCGRKGSVTGQRHIFPRQEEFLELGKLNDVFNGGLKMDKRQLNALSLCQFLCAYHDTNAGAVHETHAGEIDNELFALPRRKVCFGGVPYLFRIGSSDFALP